MRRSLLPLLLLTSFALSACGVRGDLETPPPLWGDKEKQKQEQTDDKPAE